MGCEDYMGLEGLATKKLDLSILEKRENQLHIRYLLIVLHTHVARNDSIMTVSYSHVLMGK